MGQDQFGEVAKLFPGSRRGFCSESQGPHRRLATMGVFRIKRKGIPREEASSWLIFILGSLPLISPPRNRVRLHLASFTPLFEVFYLAAAGNEDVNFTNRMTPINPSNW